ncbi:hypothetical protein CsSME_00051260 [Camellia sinensis var. sinensis]
MSSALSLARTGLSSKVISGVQGTFGILDPKVVADDDLGFFDCVDSDGCVSADLFFTEAVFSLPANCEIVRVSSTSTSVALAFGWAFLVRFGFGGGMVCVG